MLKEAIGIASSIEEAQEAARKELNAPEDADVTIEVLEMPAKKTFGLFGGSRAKVRMTYDDGKPEVIPAAVEPAVRKAKPEPKKEQPQSVAKAVEGSPDSTLAQTYLRTILEGMGLHDVRLDVTLSDGDLHIQLDCGDDYGAVIGRRGETLDALQYLTRLVVSKTNEGYKRVFINVGNYRERREGTLRDMARRNADKAKKYGKNMSLDPMNPYERRIIHTTIQEIEGVESHSVGSDSDRRVVITPAEEYRSSAPRTGTDRPDRPRRESKPEPAKSDNRRGPRSDIANTALYGKIEPKK